MLPTMFKLEQDKCRCDDKQRTPGAVTVLRQQISESRECGPGAGRDLRYH